VDIDAYMAATDAEREAYLESLSGEGLLQLGIDLYNAGHYWHAHEAWEQVWLEAPNDLRFFYQGLIQVAAAFVHVTKNEYPGSVRLLAAGIAKLEAYSPEMLGVNVAALLAGASDAQAELLRLGEKGLRGFDRTLIPRLRRTASPA
jgi:predicted metal-dependent hydrolase